MKRSLLKNIERVERKKAIGIFYNVPKNESAELVNKLLDSKRAVHIRGKFADDRNSLKNRLGNHFKIKNFGYDILSAALEGKLLVISDADFIRPSYSSIFEEMHRNKIPLLLLLNKDAALDKIRKFHSFSKIFTIEIDYNLL